MLYGNELNLGCSDTILKFRPLYQNSEVMVKVKGNTFYILTIPMFDVADVVMPNVSTCPTCQHG